MPFATIFANAHDDTRSQADTYRTTKHPIDTFEIQAPSQGASFIHAILATAIFRCWHILLFFGAWSTMVCLIAQHNANITLQPTLITVFGTVLGFVISYRTTSSFERYNEGRRLWSQIVLGSRTFARTIWFHVPGTFLTFTFQPFLHKHLFINHRVADNAMPDVPNLTDDDRKARTLVEKKTVINLLEAYAIAVKHYLRGEDNIYYVDLWPLVKFLPSYDIPATIPSHVDLPAELGSGMDEHVHRPRQSQDMPASPRSAHFQDSLLTSRRTRVESSASSLPLPSTTPGARTAVQGMPSVTENGVPLSANGEHPEKHSKSFDGARRRKGSTAPTIGMADGGYLLPAQMPPKYSFFDLFPFSLLVKLLTDKGIDVKGKKAARLRARMSGARKGVHKNDNVPLEISLYLSSYIAALQRRATVIDTPTIGLLYATLTQLVDALTGLERILTTPIPFSYSIHLWLVTVIYCLALPFQIWTALKWLTVPATVLAFAFAYLLMFSFAFFGFLVAGEEIESM
ncbi:hypothetical protein ID866_5991 [Astraeus odoratus]|nr:hypothetical protein ID866_5991 [Astraeus odoratus]